MDDSCRIGLSISVGIDTGPGVSPVFPAAPGCLEPVLDGVRWRLAPEGRVGLSGLNRNISLFEFLDALHVVC
jgi:hypothetical protein